MVLLTPKSFDYNRCTSAHLIVIIIINSIVKHTLHLYVAQIGDTPRYPEDYLWHAMQCGHT